VDRRGFAVGFAVAQRLSAMKTIQIFTNAAQAHYGQGRAGASWVKKIESLGSR